MDDILSAFTLKQIEEFLTITAYIKSNGIDVADVRAIIEKRKNDIKESIQKKEQCPECGAHLEIYPIMTPKGKRNRFGYKGRLYCDSCGLEKFY